MICRRALVGGAIATSLFDFGHLVQAAPGPRIYRIGVLDPDREVFADQWNEFVAELSRRGYVEGRNLAFERRFGEEFRPEGIDRLAVELVSLKPDLIYAAHGTLSALAVRRATKTIPIVFYSAGDPVGAGLVASFSKPGGNATGNAISSFETFPKSLQYMKEVTGKLTRVVEILPLGNRSMPWFPQMDAAIIATARRLGTSFEYVDVSSMEDIELVVKRLARERVDAVALGNLGTELRPHERRIAALFIEYRLPSFGDPDKGFLLQYEPNFLHVARKSAEYVDKILRGAKASDLPVEQVSAFELSVNQKTADAIGVKIPGSILVRADRVIR